MVEAFPSIVDVNFTATMESLLDGIGDGLIPWKTVVKNFYPDLAKSVNRAKEELEQVEDRGRGHRCGLRAVRRTIWWSSMARTASSWPARDSRRVLRKTPKPCLEKAGVPCPKCGKEIVIRKTKKGRRYYGCEAAPECDFMSWQRAFQREMPPVRQYFAGEGQQAGVLQGGLRLRAARQGRGERSSVFKKEFIPRDLEECA